MNKIQTLEHPLDLIEVDDNRCCCKTLAGLEKQERDELTAWIIRLDDPRVAVKVLQNLPELPCEPFYMLIGGATPDLMQEAVDTIEQLDPEALFHAQMWRSDIRTEDMVWGREILEKLDTSK